MPADGYVSDLARELAADALERFLRYVRIDTQSDRESDTYPSTEKQLELLRLLRDELAELGLEAELDEHGYVMARVPATVEHEVPTVGLLAHVDTSPDVTGADVKPQVVRYEGGDLPLPGDPAQVLTPHDMPKLADHVGHELVTTDGTTLLGADDKAGCAEIMAAVAYLVGRPEIPHGPLAIGFTPDEEVGHGTDHFDLARFGADVAYTLDGSDPGEIEDETFSAVTVVADFHGRNTHPGTAKNVLLSAVKMAGDFLAALPRDRSPETTDEREGFVHPTAVKGAVGACRVELILRDHDDELLADHEQLVRRLAEEAAAGRGGTVTIEATRTYTNMKRFIDDPRIVEAAEEAIRRTGLEPKRSIVRGGTDGSRFSEKGLPCPNLYTGGHDYHSLREWICVPDMGAATATIVHLAQVWSERSPS
ncbi:MAG: peptidase T [Gaiellaceae bacterium]